MLMDHSLVIRPTHDEDFAIVPSMREPFHIRKATMHDYEFIEQMQRHFSNELGFSYRAIIHKRLAAGMMDVAVDSKGVHMGFIHGNYAYGGQEQLAIVFQLAVVELFHRRLVGACLLHNFMKAAPWGNRLICCWCAQDLPANRFWEGMGFLPIAFRTGSRQRKRIHIFWQRRTRPQDTVTPLWYPKGTQGGQIAEGRVILPIPVGHSWKEDLPSLLPAEYSSNVPLLANGMPDPIAIKRTRKTLPGVDVPPQERLLLIKRRSAAFCTPGEGEIIVMAGGRMRKRKRPGWVAPPKDEREVKKRRKITDEHRDASRELRDRYLEALNEHPPTGSTKYNISRAAELAPSKLSALDSAFVERLCLPAASHGRDAASQSSQSETEHD